MAQAFILCLITSLSYSNCRLYAGMALKHCQVSRSYLISYGIEHLCLRYRVHDLKKLREQLQAFPEAHDGAQNAMSQSVLQTY